jgi:hypothetical protein
VVVGLGIGGSMTPSGLSACEARRLACHAGPVPAILDATSTALDLGRESRLFFEPQRLTAGLTHHTCAAEG